MWNENRNRNLWIIAILSSIFAAAVVIPAFAMGFVIGRWSANLLGW